MAKAFEVRWTGDLPGTAADGWDAITVNTGGWLWPIAYEPREGGAERGLTGDGGTVTTWDPPRRFVTRALTGSNELDYQFDGTHLDYTHRGEFDESEFDLQFDACQRHTDFYYHSLGEYLGHFAGRAAAAYVSADAHPGVGFATVRGALGIPDGVAAGDRVRLTPAGLAPIDGVVDYAVAPFLGVRSADTLYRFFGRDEWGWPVGVTMHVFDEAADRASLAKTWTTWLEEVR